MTWFKQSAASIALTSLCHAPVWSMSVGEPQIHSHLGQALRVTLPVTLDSAAERESLDTLRVSIDQNPIENSQALDITQLQPGFLAVRVSGSGDNLNIVLGSKQPYLEPISAIPLRISLGRTSIVREVSLLLDPPPATPVALSAKASEPARARVEASTTTQRVDKNGDENSPDVMVAPEPLISVDELALAQQKNPVRRARRQLREAKGSEPTLKQPIETTSNVLAYQASGAASSLFKLDYNFASYALLRSLNQTPAVAHPSASDAGGKAIQLASLASTAIVDSVVTQANDVAAVTAPELPPAKPARPAITTWIGVGILVFLIVGLAKRRRITEMRRIRGLKIFLLNQQRALKRVKAPRPRGLPARPQDKASEISNERSGHEDFIDGASVVAPLRVNTEHVHVASNDPTLETEVASLRSRIDAIAKRTLTTDQRTQLTVAEAHMDLNRYEAVSELLMEMEQAAMSATQTFRVQA